MADYNEVTRTNYFHVTDEERYAELFAGLCGCDIEDFTETDAEGRLYHGFGDYGNIDYYPPCKCEGCEFADTCKQTEEDKEDCKYSEEPDFDWFMAEMQKILPEDEAMIIIASGYEKLRYVSGSALVVTKKEIRSMEINDWAMSTARELLGETYRTRTDY